MAAKAEEISVNEINRVQDYTTTITILEHLSDAVFILRPQGAIEYANRVALDLLGLELPLLIGRNLNDFLVTDVELAEAQHNDSEAGFLENIYRGVFNEIETSLVHEGHATPVLISFGLVRNPSGDVDFVIASAKDISIRKALERELYQQQLLTLSRDRYRELGELAVNMVHNLSQPITSLRLSIELMQRQLSKGAFDAQKIQNKFTEMATLLDEMTHAITSVRNFAFLTEDERWKPVDIESNLNEAVKQLRYELTERNIDLQIRSAGGGQKVLANPLNIQQVFVSLIKFLEQEEKQPQFLLIALQHHRDRRIQTVIIPDENPAAFKPLSQEQSAEKIGSHLELMVVQMIMTALGGDLQITASDSGQTGFLLRFPVDVAEEREQLKNLIELMYH